ncbi:MAPEG family protein [Pseudohongiella sp. SYSU M77423]|uniref:MAPEG family protein n=1 Tax=unclassified Pseudohongiella TaxID=2629611 RepID=UPI001F3B902D|nr:MULTISPECIES: MAPEG family protein [unclassified Pseudohongiella]MDH7943580.1 MAPEG family protein [Pseudohongiella sp. SYSU M77423]MEC8859150.1 MAPEG family protein [Pseudomonadota bacterium]
MAWVMLIVAVALLQYIVFGVQVGRARGKYNVPAPAVQGDPTFERYYRVQMNTLESLVIFLPAIYMFANSISAFYAAILGLIFVIGRQLYAIAYVKDPKTRGLGFALTMLPNLFLVIGAIVAAVMALLPA